MKRTFMVALCGLLFSMAAFSASRQPTCEVELQLVDSQTGDTLPGLIQFVDQAGQRIALRLSSPAENAGTELMSRGLGLKDQPRIEDWSVVTGSIKLQLPCQRMTLRAFSGLETELTELDLNLSPDFQKQFDVPLRRFYHAAGQKWRSANTHVHLMKLEKDTADRYLKDVPRADGLDLVFVSYLERAEADRDYISNRYSRTDLNRLQASAGILFGNGEEHRHNFATQGQGYGHVMLLDISQLIQPVSIGPGITKTGTDGLPLQRGIDQAHRDNATVIWCHNTLGLERIANQVTGRIDAQNIFDGSMHRSYEDGFYRSLNAGLKVPFSTGTDWFIYDFSRTYTKVDGPLTTSRWLTALKKGRTYITNGPFLEFQVADREPGDQVELSGPALLAIKGRAIGRADFGRIELIQNGRVVQSEISRKEKGHYIAEFSSEMRIESPCWFALRTPQPLADETLSQTRDFATNEYGKPIFSHTSAVDISIGGKQYFDRIVANELLTEIRSNLETVNQQAIFADSTEKAQVTDVYNDAIAELEKRLGRKAAD